MLRRPAPAADVVLRALGLLLAAAVLGTVTAAFLLAPGLAGRPGVVGDPVPAGQLLVDVVIAVAGAALTTARPRNLVGWALLGLGLLGAVQNAASVYGIRALTEPGDGATSGALALSLGASLWVPALFLVTPVLVLLYPSGHLPSPGWRWVVGAGALGAVALTVAVAMSPDGVDDFVRGAVPVAELRDPWLGMLTTVGGVLALAAAVAGVGGTVWRTVRARGRERQQLLWLLLAASVVLAVALVEPPDWLLTVALALVPVAVVVGVLAFGLLDVDVVLRGTLLYGVLTGLVLAVYVGTTAALSAVVPAGAVPTVVAAALVAVLLAPARTRLQRLVDHLVRGTPPDPLAVVRSVGAQVAHPSGDAVPGMVAVIAEATGAGRVAIVDPDGAVLAETGGGDGPAVVVPLMVGTESLGDLVAAWHGRRTGDRRLLETLAGPVAVVLHARRLQREVADARERLLRATLEERQRIRRDLHDGLGPALSGMVLGLDALASRLPTDPGTAVEITTRLRVEGERAVEEVRRIIDALRPPALDGQGLVPALRERAASLQAALRDPLVVEVEAPDPMPDLPEQVEVAAYRIADEAVHNVIRHAGARHCLIRLVVDSALTVEVHDDGRGLSDGQPESAGLGLRSMRRRAEDLGGSFETTPRRGGNTVVARLPLAVP